MSEDNIKLKEDQMLYPPMFVIKVRGSSSAENSKVIFTFEGATEKIVKEVILTKGILGTVYACRLLGRCLRHCGACLNNICLNTVIIKNMVFGLMQYTAGNYWFFTGR